MPYSLESTCFLQSFIFEIEDLYLTLRFFDDNLFIILFFFACSFASSFAFAFAAAAALRAARPVGGSVKKLIAR